MAHGLCDFRHYHEVIFHTLNYTINLGLSFLRPFSDCPQENNVTIALNKVSEHNLLFFEMWRQICKETLQFNTISHDLDTESPHSVRKNLIHRRELWFCWLQLGTTKRTRINFTGKSGRA